jgi:ElaB protein
MHMTTSEQHTEAVRDRIVTDRLVADLGALAADAGRLVEAASDQTGRTMARGRAKARESLQTARQGLADLQGAAVSQARAAGEATDRYVHSSPWRLMALGAAVGFLLGALAGRRRDAGN